MIVKVIKLPVSIQVSKNKRFPINLNHYRNAHYQTLNKAKQTFKDVISKSMLSIPHLQHIKLVYRVYPATAQELDVANICSIADKFFSDALVEYGKIKDDNFKYVKKVEYEYGHVDRQNPHIDVEIHDLTQPLSKDLTDDEDEDHLLPPTPPKSERLINMKIFFQEEEILAILQGYIARIMHLNPEVQPVIDLTTGTDGSIQATLEVMAANIQPVQTTGPKLSPPNLSGQLQGTRDAVREALKEPTKRTSRSLAPPASKTAEGAPEAAQPSVQPISEQAETKQATGEVVSLLKTKPDIGDRPIPAPAAKAAEKAEDAPVAQKPVGSLFQKGNQKPSISTGEERVDPNNPENLPVAEEGAMEAGAESDEAVVNQEPEPENPTTVEEPKTETEPVQTAEKPRPTLGISFGTKKPEPSPAPVEEATRDTEQAGMSANTNLGGSVPAPEPRPSIFNFKKS